MLPRYDYPSKLEGLVHNIERCQRLSASQLHPWLLLHSQKSAFQLHPYLLKQQHQHALL